jgi:hypothetical protein
MRAWASLAASLALLGMTCPAHAEPGAGPAQAFAAARADLAGHDDGFFVDDPTSVPAFRRQWLAAEAFTADFLSAHPDADGPALNKALAGLDPTLGVSRVQLDPTSVLVGLQLGEQGDVFILTGPSGKQNVAWRLADMGHPADAALRAWADESALGSCRDNRPDADWADCGGIYPAFYPLPDAADGARRFALVGTYAQPGGETVSAQLSFWRWDGHAPTLSLLRTYSSLLDSSDIKLVGDSMRVPVKGEFKSFLSCGSCAGRQGVWRFKLTANGVQDLGEAMSFPWLDAVDHAYELGRQHLVAPDLISAQVSQFIAGQIAEGEPNGAIMGSLDGWMLAKDHRRLCVSTNDGGAVVFTLQVRGGRIFLQSATKAGDGSCSEAVHWPGAASGS